MADDKKTAQEAPAPAPTQAAPSAKNPLVTLLLLLNLVAVSGIGYLQWKSFQKEASEPNIKDIIKQEMKSAETGTADPSKEEAPSEGQLFPLEAFTANLAQGDGPRRFLRLNAVLKFSSDSKEAEFKARKPQIRDTIISILNAKRPEDLLKKEGKNYLKEEIKAAINSYLVDGKVDDIFYVGFQIN